MQILAFESSAKAASVALLTDGMLTAEVFQNCGLTHSVTLLTMAEDLLRQTNQTLQRIDLFAAAHGPGSFTGVRIGVSAVKGLAWGQNKPCMGVSTLAAMAMLHASQDGILCPVMDARRNQVYNALFLVEKGKIQRLTPDRAIAISDLAEELKQRTGKNILVGDGAQLCYNSLQESRLELVLVPEHVRLQRASGVALAAWRNLQTGGSMNAAELLPSYLRLSQAERERMEKLEKEHKEG